MKKKLCIAIFSIFLIFSLNCWGKKSSKTSSPPATTSTKTNETKKQVETAKKNAESAKLNAENAKKATDAKQAMVESKQAEQKAKENTAINLELSKKSAEARAEALAGKPGAAEAYAEAEKARMDAEKAQIEAYKAKNEADKALEEFNLTRDSWLDAEAQSKLSHDEYEEFQRLLAESKKADEEFNKTFDLYTKKTEKLNEKIKDLEDITGKHNEPYNNKKVESLVKDINNAKIEADKYADVTAEVADKVYETYEKLGDFKEKYGLTGDPVNIATGSYLANYIDFQAQDYLQPFTIDRSYLQNITNESFGNAWVCSLDSRIIRCNYKSYKNIKDSLVEIDTMLNEMKADFDNYNQDYPKYPRTEECTQYYNEIAAKKADNDADIRDVDEIQKKYEELQELNKYVTYGRYVNPDAYFGYDNQIRFIESDGREYSFIYDTAGKWRCAGKISAANMWINGINDIGNLSTDENTFGGYIVNYSDGRQKKFNKYGILVSETDRNGNVTSYENINGRINKVILKTGEEIIISRNADNYIVSVEGVVSGKTSYKYDNNKLKSVIDNEGVKVSYEYNNQNYLTKIKKADDNFVQINYSDNQNNGIYYCTSVINENKNIEYFDYDFINKKLKHTTYDGKIEEYKFDSFENPVYVKDKYENVTIITPNEDELVNTYIQNNVKKQIEYDEYFRPSKMYLDNGGVVFYEYNNFGEISKLTDADGFIRSYEYDEKGNIIFDKYCGNVLCEYVYYPNGLLKETHNNNSITEYVYNKYGSIIEKKITLEDGNSYLVSAEYNQNNKLTKYVDETGIVTNYIYEPSKIIETTLNKKTEYYFDNRNREFKTIISDLKNGITHTIEKKYDGKGNLVKIFLDDKCYREYSYSKDDILNEEKHFAISSDENSFEIITNVYNQHGYLQNQSKKCGEKDFTIVNRIFDFSNNMLIKNQNENGTFTTYEYDKYGNLIKETNPDGYYIKTTYSKAGRIESKIDSDNNIWKYIYNQDGSYSIELLMVSGLKSIWKYDLYNQLFYYKDFAGNVIRYEYDMNGNIIIEKNPLYEIQNKYDIYNRKNYTKTTDKNGKKYFEYSVEFNDIENTATIIRGNEIYKSYNFDLFGNVIKSTGGNGSHQYTYDILGNCLSDTDARGNKISYLYDANYNVSKKYNPDGTFESYNYNQFGKMENLYINDKLYYSYENQSDKNTIIVKDCYGSENKFFYDSNATITGFETSKTGFTNIKNKFQKDIFGNVVKEELPERTLDYNYDLNGRITAVLKNGNFYLQKNYSDNNVTTTYYDGSKTEIFKDCFGNITKIKNDNSILEYEYNPYGKMTSSFDSISNIKVDYEYDKYDRCVEKKSNNFDLIYQYDECGNIEKITETKSGTWVFFEYDLLYREIRRTFWNGIITRTNYDSNGFMESRITENNFNQIINADFILRDENNRISIIVDENGDFEKYTYDEKGRLINSVIPFTDENYNYYLNEFIDCGLPYSIDNKIYTEIMLSEKETTSLRKIIENSKVNGNIQITNYQKSWIDEFGYTDSGAVSFVKNTFGKMVYEYDDNNRLQKKFVENFPEYNMTFKWNTDGSLKNVDSNTKSITIEYSVINKPLKVEIKNKRELKEKTIIYKYDALGRRINEIDETKSYVNIFDGTTENLIGKFVTQNDYTVNDFYLKTNNSKEKHYRWIDDNGYMPYGTAKTLTNETRWTNDNREDDKKDERSYFLMSLYKEPLAYIYLDGNKVCGLDANNLVLDYKSNCVGVCDSNANCIAKNYYDIWGNCISYNKNPLFNYSNDYLSGDFPLFNLGARDYAASLKSFISEDTARDGGNWYGYCCTDPVNYFDYCGNNIIPIIQKWLMTDPELKNEKLGNSNKTLINDAGCYLITFANILFTLKYNGFTPENEDYTDPLEINNDKKLFGKGDSADEIKYGDLLDKTLGKGNYNVYNNLKNNPKIVNALLTKVKYSFDYYCIAGVLDLSEANKKVFNHMLGLNNEALDNNILDVNDITCSSEKDKERLDNYSDTYRTDNVKKLVLIKISSGTDKCIK